MLSETAPALPAGRRRWPRAQELPSVARAGEARIATPEKPAIAPRILRWRSPSSRRGDDDRGDEVSGRSRDAAGDIGLGEREKRKWRDKQAQKRCTQSPALRGWACATRTGSPSTPAPQCPHTADPERADLADEHRVEDKELPQIVPSRTISSQSRIAMVLSLVSQGTTLRRGGTKSKHLWRWCHQFM